MSDHQLQLNFREPVLWFAIGWSLILLVPILSVLPSLQTFMHPWRAEFAASVLLLITLGFLAYRSRDKIQGLCFPRSEIYFIVLPLATFIAWSGLSIFWSPSWKSALYHTLVWAEYLIFYVIVRQILEKKDGFKTLAVPLTIMLLIIALPPVFEYLSFLVFGGATSLGMRYAKYGELFNTVCPLIAVAALRLDGKRFFFALLAILTMWLFIISTLSRTNLVVFVFGLAAISLAIFVFRRFHKYRLKIALLLLGVVLVPVLSHTITFFNEEPNVPLVKRVTDENIAYSTDVRKLLKSVSLEMFFQNPLTGVGADNFGTQFNDYRVLYAEKNPFDVNLMTAESEIAGRSHNEYLQILAELGAVGGAIFLWFLGGIALMAFTALRRWRRVSLIPLASLMGIAFFLASSLVSSFSFRLVQNGFVFFFVLAVAAKFLLDSKFSEKASRGFFVSANRLRLGYGLGIAACLLLTAHCLIRIAGSHYSHLAQMETDVERALPYYQTSFWLDDENPNFYYACGMDLFYAGRYSEAASYLRRAIDAQRATSIEYSYLATAQSLSGDAAGAEKTIAEALRLYPFSTFIRARYATILKENGKTEESAEQLRRAFEINKPEANTWWTMMNEGARQASLRAARDKEFVTVMKLNPEAAIYAIVTEREIKHPEEKFSIKFDGN